MGERWGTELSDLRADHAARDLEVEYLGLAVANLMCVASPEVIVLGGGIVAAEGILGRVRSAVERRLAGYLRAGEESLSLSDRLVSPSLGARADVVGAFALGLRAAREAQGEGDPGDGRD